MIFEKLDFKKLSFSQFYEFIFKMIDEQTFLLVWEKLDNQFPLYATIKNWVAGQSDVKEEHGYDWPLRKTLTMYIIWL